MGDSTVRSAGGLTAWSFVWPIREHRFLLTLLLLPYLYQVRAYALLVCYRRAWSAAKHGSRRLGRRYTKKGVHALSLSPAERPAHVDAARKSGGHDGGRSEAAPALVQSHRREPKRPHADVGAQGLGGGGGLESRIPRLGVDRAALEQPDAQLGLAGRGALPADIEIRRRLAG